MYNLYNNYTIHNVYIFNISTLYTLMFNNKIHTCEWINPYSGTHLLELHPELRVFTDFLFMLAGKLLQMGLKGF